MPLRASTPFEQLKALLKAARPFPLPQDTLGTRNSEGSLIDEVGEIQSRAQNLKYKISRLNKTFVTLYRVHTILRCVLSSLPVFCGREF